MLTIKAALTGVLAFTGATTAALAEPKTNLLSQWSEGSDAAAIAKLGEMFTAAGGKWEQTSIAGHTANTLAKLRADVVAGNAPPAPIVNSAANATALRNMRLTPQSAAFTAA